MNRKMRVLAIALVVIAVVAFTLTSIAFADGPQSQADTCYPWEDGAGWGGSEYCDGSSGDQHQHGAGPGQGAGWGEPGNGMGPYK